MYWWLTTATKKNSSKHKWLDLPAICYRFLLNITLCDQYCVIIQYHDHFSQMLDQIWWLHSRGILKKKNRTTHMTCQKNWNFIGFSGWYHRRWCWFPSKTKTSTQQQSRVMNTKVSTIWFKHTKVSKRPLLTNKHI